MSHPEHGPLTEARAAEILDKLGSPRVTAWTEQGKEWVEACKLGAAALRELASLRAVVEALEKVAGYAREVIAAWDDGAIGREIIRLRDALEGLAALERKPGETK